MGTYNSAILTNAGQSLIANAISGGGVVQFTSVQTSNYAYPGGTSIPSLTELQDVQQTVQPFSAQVFNDTMIQVSSRFDNSAVSEAYLIQTIGIFAQLGSEPAVLFAVVQATTPDQMPASSAVSPSAFIYNVQITVQQAASIAVTINPAGTATVQDFEELRSQIALIKSEWLVNLLTSGWTGESAPYTQTVAVEGMKAEYEPLLVRALSKEATEEEKNAYDKAFGIIASGTGETGEGTVTFRVFKKPETDCKVGLKGV